MWMKEQDYVHFVVFTSKLLLAQCVDLTMQCVPRACGMCPGPGLFFDV